MKIKEWLSRIDFKSVILIISLVFFLVFLSEAITLGGNKPEVVDKYMVEREGVCQNLYTIVLEDGEEIHVSQWQYEDTEIGDDWKGKE